MLRTRNSRRRLARNKQRSSSRKLSSQRRPLLELLEERRLLAISQIAWLNTAGAGEDLLTDHSEPPAGHHAWDLAVSTSSDWTRARLDVDLTAGSIFNATSSLADGDFEPDPQWASVPVEDGGNPDLEWDSYVTTPEGAGSSVFVDSQASDGITDTQFRMEWFDAIYSAPGQHRIAQLTLSDDAQGTFRATVFDSDSAGSAGTEIFGVIVNGTPIVDESHLPNPALPADVDSDGQVTGLDFLAIQQGYGKSAGATASNGDVSGDQVVDGYDLAIWEAGYPYADASTASPGDDQDLVPMADFDGSGVVTGLDFLAWQADVGSTNSTSTIAGIQSPETGDLGDWEDQYGQTTDEISADAIFLFPTPLNSVNPAGSLIYQEEISTTIGFSGDSDVFFIDIDDGQTITVVVEADSSLQPVVELFNSSGISAATATASTAGEDAVIQTIPTTGAGTYTITVGGAAGTTGTYTVRILLNAAVEEELHDGPTNNTLGTAQDLDPSFVGLGFGTAERGAVLGRGESSGGGTLSLRQDNNVFSPNVLTFDFASAPTPQGDGVLTLTTVSDLDLTTEFLTLDAEGLFSQNLFGLGGLQQQLVTTTVNISQSQLAAMLADDGNITFTVTPSSSVNNLGSNYLTLDLSYPASPPTTDYYSFSLAAGQSASLALSGGSVGGGSLELLDSTGTLLTTGAAGASVDQVITNFVSATGGTYYANVIAGNANYSLIVTKDADFDTEANGSLATAMDISTNGTVLGSVGTDGASVVLDAIDRGWFSNLGEHTTSNKNTLTGAYSLGEVRSFFVFDLSSLSGEYASVTFNLELENYYGIDSSELAQVYDVSATAAELGADYSPGDPLGIAIFDDLGTGNMYAAATFTPSDIGSVMTINLDAQAVQDIRSSVGDTFAVGVRVASPLYES